MHDLENTTDEKSTLRITHRACFGFANARLRCICPDSRHAIFDGQPKTALTLMQAAKSNLIQAQKEAPKFAAAKARGSASDASGTPSAVERVPFDGQLVLADNFVMTPEKQAHINKANEHLKKGEHEKALEELRLGEIDLNYTQLLIPISQSEKHLERAIAFANDGKYYEANLALKAIEDSATADSISLEDLPSHAK